MLYGNTRYGSICLRVDAARQGKDWDNADGEPSRIIVLDWELNYVKTYQLAHHTNSFAIDVRNNRILYTAANDEGHTILYYWKETFDDVK